MTLKSRFFTPFTVILFSIVISSCGSSSDSSGPCDGFLWTQEISDETVALTEAGSAFGQDPTLEKCEVYKDSFRDYIDALEDVNVSCFTTGANEEEYRAALAEAKTEVNELNCSEEVEN